MSMLCSSVCDSLQSHVVCVADVAFEMSMNDNFLTGTIPAELQYLPIRVGTVFKHC